MDTGISDAVYQDQILPHVSRTFALTIPQLPAELRISVTNAYLLCRIADTIEDEPALSPPETQAYMQRFVSVLAGRGDAESLARELETRLSDRTLPSERDLVRNLQRVMNVTSALSEAQRAAIHRCVELMCYGMPRFQSTASRNGLPRLTDLDDYATTWRGSWATCSPSCFANTRRSLPAAGPRCKACPCRSRKGCK